jgi:hypothetical protein
MPLAELTDEAWQEIAAHSGLPSAARCGINCAIAFYRASEITLSPGFSPAETKMLLDDIGKRASVLRNDLNKLVNNPLAVMGLTLAIAEDDFCRSMDARIAEAALDGQTTALVQLERSLKIASEKILEARPGASRQAILRILFVHMLDEIFFEFNGRHIARDTKGQSTGRDYVAAVCRVAEFDIGPGSIEEAIKQLKRARGGITRGTKG